MKNGVSIIICCYNSRDRLSNTLSHIAHQRVPNNIFWEIIVVNNRSTDDTATAAIKLWALHGLSNINFRVITQNKPGLIFARHSGVKAAKYEYILFCDDDNWLDRNYLARAHDIMTKNPEVGALGGVGVPEIESGALLPDWFHKRQSSYALGPQAISTGVVPRHLNLYGAGLVTRKSLYLDAYPYYFPSLLKGRTGNSLTSGEDTEYCYRLRLRNKDLFYDAGLNFKHYIPKNRLTEEYNTKLIEGYEAARKKLVIYALLQSASEKNKLSRVVLLIKIALGYFSSKILSRNSWNLQDVKRVIFFISNLNFGIDVESKLAYEYYKKGNTQPF